MNCFKQNICSKLIITTVLLVYLRLKTIEARPSISMTEPEIVNMDTPAETNLYNGDLSPHVISQIQKCDMDLETMELCMRCAKVTKSEIVYPMCCDNEEGVKDWCHAYIFFGATPSPS